MAIIDTDKVVTVSQLVEELKVSIPTARGLVEKLSPEATINRTGFYLREDIKAELRARNEHLLSFLDVLSPEKSYDANILASVEASEDGE
jgi:Mn-dependent DtxR family transcriptional regulator